ncbi:GNAT family N-acetyltransferase [Stenotrophomonas sp. 24(2023)]|uniref:GNAT family N-acetyltransferase n=1 Tax=Stenotrophomonas sp. 24(2023) TaxID=3068324 RepID=UPI0027E0A6FE|nr:GNAT family N-acetyltransferase [Stenotrophomonas sp. 24(2023)]WMJ69594.1 GNAT family N-acetyltransferase [Stenotrophomonas sp. 24(2023)]
MNASTTCLFREAVPSVEDYCQLRQLAGLSAKSREAAERGLPNTVFGVCAYQGSELVAMGRIIGDGGCHLQVVDIAVLPRLQGQGLGKAVMQRLGDWMQANLPPTAYVSLLADGEAHRLYAQYGFALTAPASLGMYRRF